MLWFIFKDATSAKETYGGGRFLYAEMPKDGKVVVDFNQAYNPPCAFTPYATCPCLPSRTGYRFGSRRGRRSSPAGITSPGPRPPDRSARADTVIETPLAPDWNSRHSVTAVTSEIVAMAGWLLLAHRVPRDPTAHRVAVWRKLKRLGAVLILDSVWALPANARTREHLRWLAAEIEESGGEVLIWESSTIVHGGDADLRRLFLEAVGPGTRKFSGS